jgi:hypothetical protein
MMIKRFGMVGALLLASIGPALAAPGDMSVATFLGKAEALKQKGAMALMSPDLGVLKQEGTAAGAAYRERLTRERAAGRPSSCPPKGARINSDQLLAHLKTYPVSARAGTSIKTAMADYFIKAWPCR